jgi:hypothetical protein
MVLGGLGYYQQKQLQTNRQLLAELQAKLKTAEAQLADQAAAADKVRLSEQKAKILQETLTETAKISEDQSKQVSELQQSLTSAKTNSGFAAMFKDPAMKDMIKAQQKAVMGPMIEKNYAALFKQLNLTPEQTATVKELLEKKMLTGAEMGMSMLDGSADAEKRKELGKEIKAATDAIDQQLKDYLGSESYSTLQSYEKTVGDRMTLSQFKDQLSGSDPLDSGQEQQLLDIVGKERSNYKWSANYNNPDPSSTDFTELFSEDRMNRHFEEQTDFDKQLLQKLETVLRPDQLTSYGKFLENQRNMQKAAMKMAAAMFGGQKK